MSSEIRIQTERFTLRPLTESDRDQVVRLLDDFEVARWLTVVPHPYTAADYTDFLTHLADTSVLGGLAIEEDGQVLGVVGLDPTLGYWLGRAHHNRGVMTEAAGGLVDWAFRNQDITELGSGYFEGNTASQTVLHRIGFRETSMIEDVHCTSQGIDTKLIKVSLDRSVWEKSQ
ncbi:GNAT family N-acetyltransferase [Aliiroseovarius sp. 2305UL8-7]|uniref:GNAT family N-acetyltransferase n=1 Tax=Aliiroseovarius conchicola TaxID=3121637 RepID=UPI003526E289